MEKQAKKLQAFRIAGKALFKMAPSLLTILGVVGLILGILTPETITRLVGAEAGLIATATAAVLGAITLIPSLIAFPLAGSLLRSGATAMTVSVFITTLVMVGIVTARDVRQGQWVFYYANFDDEVQREIMQAINNKKNYYLQLKQDMKSLAVKATEGSFCSRANGRGVELK